MTRFLLLHVLSLLNVQTLVKMKKKWKIFKTILFKNCVFFPTVPRFFKIYTTVDKSIETCQFFISNEWTWDNAVYNRILDAIPEKEKETFSFDMTKIEWKHYYEALALGIKVRWIISCEKKSAGIILSRLTGCFRENMWCLFKNYCLETFPAKLFHASSTNSYFTQEMNAIKYSFKASWIYYPIDITLYLSVSPHKLPKTLGLMA